MVLKGKIEVLAASPVPDLEFWQIMEDLSIPTYAVNQIELNTFKNISVVHISVKYLDRIRTMHTNAIREWNTTNVGGKKIAYVKLEVNELKKLK